MNNQNKLNLTLAGKTVMENISLAVKTRRRGFIVPACKTASSNFIRFDDDNITAEITIRNSDGCITLGARCEIKDDLSSSPDSFDPETSIIIEFSAPPVNVSFGAAEQKVFFTNFNTMPDKTQRIMAKCDNGYITYSPLGGGNYLSYLKGRGTYAALIIAVGCGGYTSVSGDVIKIDYISSGYGSLNHCHDSVNKNTFDADGRIGLFAGGMGSGEIFRKIEALRAHNVFIKLVILDLYRSCPTLRNPFDFGTRFENGLPDFIKKLKQDYGIEQVGARYPLGLALRGVEKNSEAHRSLGKFLDSTHSGRLFPSCDVKKARELYNLINSRLSDDGISFVIPSDENALIGCVLGNISAGEAKNTYMTSFVQSADDVFPKGLLFDRYDPNGNAEIKSYIKNRAYLTALNEIVPDCGFAVNNLSSRAEKAFFAVSGDDLFVSQIPAEDISGFVSRGGNVLKCDGILSVCRRNLFSDPSIDSKALRLFNRCNNSGIVAAFNISEKGETVRGNICASDVDGLEGNRFICRLVKENRYIVSDRDTLIPISLSKDDAELASFTPIVNGFAFVGNIDKLLSGASFVKQGNEYLLTDGGHIALYCERPFKSNCKFNRFGNIWIADTDNTHITIEI